MKLRLEALDAPGKSVHEFVDEVIVFGRDAVCDLALPGVSAVSGRHAQITLTPEGAFLSDVGSTNGTFVNDRRIEGRVKVRPGDFFRLGHTGPSFRIAEIDLTPRAAAPAPRFRPAPVPEPAVPVAIVSEDEGHTAPLPVPPRPRAEPPRPRAEPRARAEAPEPRTAPRAPAGPGGQTRMMVVSLQQKNRNMMIGIGGAILLLLLAVAATGIFFMVRTSRQGAEQREQARLQEEQRKEQEAKIAAAAATAESAKSIATLSKQDEETIFRRYSDAVFLVALYAKSGEVIPFGTAFSIHRDGKFGTNAHVALPVNDFLKKGFKVCVISPGGKKEYPVVGAVGHPRYNESARVQTPDVGILTARLSGGDALPNVVELASDDELRRLGPGAPLCYIGFPGWSEYTALNKVAPHIYKGGLSRLMTLEEEVGDFGRQYLIDHDLATINGASGSPIFNREGKVVAIHNSGEKRIAIDANGKPVPIPVGPKHGMRVDLLRELMKSNP